MKITWLGHACFLLQDNNGKKILIDPYGGDYPIPKVEVDVVITSHRHWDHNATDRVKSKLHIYSAGEYKFENVIFSEIPCFHDNVKGAERGDNLISIIELDGMKICHFGDLGEDFSQDLVEKIGDIDIALICVGGIYTIDCATAEKFISALNPKITIPMHFRYGDWFNELDKVDKFISLWHNKIMRIPHNYIDLEPENLPGENTLIVFQI